MGEDATMSTYAQLKSEIESLQARANEVLKAEKATAVAEIQRKIVQFGITAADLGLETRRAGRPPKRSDEAQGQDESADARSSSPPARRLEIVDAFPADLHNRS